MLDYNWLDIINAIDWWHHLTTPRQTWYYSPGSITRKPNSNSLRVMVTTSTPKETTTYYRGNIHFSWVLLSVDPNLPIMRFREVCVPLEHDKKIQFEFVGHLGHGYDREFIEQMIDYNPTRTNFLRNSIDRINFFTRRGDIPEVKGIATIGRKLMETYVDCSEYF